MQYSAIKPLGDQDLSESLLQFTNSEIKSVMNCIEYANTKPLSTSQSIGLIGTLVDLSEDFNYEDGIKAAIRMALGILNSKEPTPAEKAKLQYCIGNCHYALWKRSQKQNLAWNDERIESAIYHYRKAIRPDNLNELDKFHICQLYTNLANSLSVTGRFIEALEYWDRALHLDPTHLMARGNRGIGLMRYGRLYSHAPYSHKLLSFAYYELFYAGSLSNRADATPQFQQRAHTIRKAFSDSPLDISMSLPTGTVGDSKEERKYREWCLQNRLFLNPLNDIGQFSIAASDVITETFDTQTRTRATSCHGLLNRIKQEYVSARYLLYQGMSYDDLHYSDKNVGLKNTLDYPEYGYAIEMLRTSLRNMFSLFDKIAFFINYYFEVGMDEKKVKRNKIWEDEQWAKDLKNISLCALYWLDKDFRNQGGVVADDSLDPGMGEVRERRNIAEHRYLKVHWMIPDREHQDELAHSIKVEELEDYALRTAKKARAAIFYLLTAVKLHEQKRADDGIHTPPVYFGEWEDKWKKRP